MRPQAVRDEDRRDRRGLPPDDPGPAAAVAHAIRWLCVAQDRSASADGGVARHYSLRTGWGRSYPETTGYIVPTLLARSARGAAPELRDRVRRMLDWLVTVQLPSGALQAGVVGDGPPVPVVFNTGQALHGFAAGVREFGDAYRGPLSRAADWLVAVQDDDGCWRRHGSPLVIPGPKVYDLHAAWGLLEAERVIPGRGYADAALANVRWALSRQRPNGWFADCCLDSPSRPLTHALGYALRGLIEAYRFSGDPAVLDAGRRAADGILSALRPDGFLPGRLDEAWRGRASWACLTGTAQIAICWLQLHMITGHEAYREAGFLANRFVRRTMKTAGPEEVVGGIKGSFPAWGGYGTHQYLNWAAKFFVDANVLESEVRGG